ncbi:arylsulfatase [Streptomyces sp. N2-109]|uniref:Arylsulfatase n=1 Tax=Streptomyces gossypii TaxID=2883101 RepID=A0ABT2K1R7_9ACTN|nr:arylsulfatase [Streptomyces gossypii]MCT2594120.1 arylsulfatase [Streptomyces gossypii]
MHVTTTSRRRLLAGGSAVVGLAGMGAAATAFGDEGRTAGALEPDRGKQSRRTPNFVLVLADDLGHGEVGAYGQRLIATPRLDEIAAGGLRFTQAYAPAPVCAPSRCSMLTGLHSGHATVRTNPFRGGQPGLGDDDTTFAELLSERGYRTACIGKWGFGPEEADQPSHPNRRGFQEFYGYISHGAAHDYYPAELWDNGRPVPVPANRGDERGSYAPELFRQRALDFVSRQAADDKPFLLYLAPTTPHAPSREVDHGDYAGHPWPEADRGHAAQVSHLDALVGDLVDLLRAEGLAEDTVLLVSSDNGAHEEGGTDPERFDANGSLRGYKRNLYEGGIRVPLIAWAPSRIAPGSETGRRTPLTDMLPTLAELAGAKVPGGLDGLSLAGLIGGDRSPPHPYLYWYRNDPHTSPRAQAADRGRGRRACEALRQGDWKAVRFAPARDRSAPDDSWDVELYNLRDDPGERRNVAAEHPRTVKRLVALMHEAWRDPALPAPTDRPPVHA